jgi:hypothetical protein
VRQRHKCLALLLRWRKALGVQAIQRGRYRGSGTAPLYRSAQDTLGIVALRTMVRHRKNWCARQAAHRSLAAVPHRPTPRCHKCTRAYRAPERDVLLQAAGYSRTASPQIAARVGDRRRARLAGFRRLAQKIPLGLSIYIDRFANSRVMRGRLAEPAIADQPALRHSLRCPN